MSALATERITEQVLMASPATTTRKGRQRRRISPELASVIQEIAESERALDDVLARSQRMHRSGIDHSPLSCLVCFDQR